MASFSQFGRPTRRACRSSAIQPVGRRKCQMRKRIDSGLWEILFRICGPAPPTNTNRPRTASCSRSSRPFGFEAEMRPSTARCRPPTILLERRDYLENLKQASAAPADVDFEVHLAHGGAAMTIAS